GKDAGAVEGRRALAAARGERGRLIAAEAHDGRDAVRRIQTEIAHDVLGRVASALKASGVADVAVRVDETGDHRLAADRYGPGSGRHYDVLAGGDNTSFAYDDRRVVDRRALGAVDQA